MSWLIVELRFVNKLNWWLVCICHGCRAIFSSMTFRTIFQSSYVATGYGICVYIEYDYRAIFERTLKGMIWTNGTTDARRLHKHRTISVQYRAVSASFLWKSYGACNFAARGICLRAMGLRFLKMCITFYTKSLRLRSPWIRTIIARLWSPLPGGRTIKDLRAVYGRRWWTP